MYMDILEQEVEALSAEVTRLRLMVHRVTQVMEAPAPRSDSAAVHVDPLRAAPVVAHTGTAAAPPHDLQATVDSYKQILPLVQLLLAQQQQQHQREEQRRTSRGASRSRRQQRRSRQEDHKPTKASSSSREKRRASSSSSSQASATSSATSASASDSTDGEAPLHTASPVAGAPAPQAQHADRTPASASHAATRVTAQIKVPTFAVEADSASRVGVDSVAAGRHSSGEGAAAGAVGAEPGSASVLERLRAQRQREAATEQSDSSDSSNVMPMAKPQFSPTTASPMTSSARRKYVMNATTVSIVAPKETIAAELAAAASQSLPSTSLVSSKLRQAPSKAPVQMSASPVSSKPGSLYSGAALPASVSNSLVHSEYGAYSYGALPSAFNSPAMSHVADDPVSALRASRVSLSSPQALPLESTVAQQSSKHLPHQTSALSPTPRAAASASSRSSDDSSDGEAAQLQSALQSTTKPSPFKAGLILGARQPIGVHALTGPPPPPAAPNDKRAAALAASLSGPYAAVPARSEMLPGTRPIAPTGTSSTSSSSDNAVFRPPPSRRQAAPAMHQDSSFHNYSETTSSQEARGAGLVSPPPHGDPSRSQSQDAYSFAAYSLQYSSHGRTPRQQDIAGGGSPLSQSATPHQSPQSASLVASSASRRGSIAAGGYYYGYDLNAASVSQQSVASNSAAEAS